MAKLVTVTTPKYKVNRGLSADHARRVLEVARDERLYALYVSALCIGLLVLRWEDIDLDAGTLEVAQTLQRVGETLRFVRPKTDDSQRTVPLPGICVEALREHRERQRVERSEIGRDWTDHGLVFPSATGTPIARHVREARRCHGEHPMRG